MSFLLDTNVVSELRRGDAADPGVIAWFDDRSPRELFLSVLTIGEIRRGIENLRPKHAKQAALLDRWLKGLVEFYEDRLMYVDGGVADEWGQLLARHNPPAVDALLAATARVHQLTVVTRNTRDFGSLDVPVLNPWRPRRRRSPSV